MPCMCGDTQCWSCGAAQGTLEPSESETNAMVLKVRIDPAYGEVTSEGGFHGHDDRLELSWWFVNYRGELECYETMHFDLTPDGALEMLESALW